MKRQPKGGERPSTLAELLAAPVNNKQVRRILEFCYPLTLFGVPGIPGHFQLGTLSRQKE